MTSIHHTVKKFWQYDRQQRMTKLQMFGYYPRPAAFPRFILLITRSTIVQHQSNTNHHSII